MFGVGSGPITNCTADPPTARFTPPQSVKTTLRWTQGESGYIRIERRITGVSSRRTYEDWRQVYRALRSAGDQTVALGAYLTMDEDAYVYFRIFFEREVSMPAPAPAPAEEHTVTVRVFDGATREPIAGARVLMDGKFVGTTKSDGTLSVGGVPEGHHRFTAGAPEYEPRTVGIDVPATLSVGIGLVRA